MAGSTLIVNAPSKSSRHDLLDKRNISYQHILESIYRGSDGKNLSDILSEISLDGRSVSYQRIPIILDGQRVVNITDFSYNMVSDLLFVSLQGLEVYEGIELDYVKTSPTQITFNYDLKAGYEVFIFIAGTISATSYGDAIYNSLSKFTQLVDTPDNYYGHEGHVPQVNESETGLIFAPIKASTELVKIQKSYSLDTNTYIEEWINFAHRGIIKGIKITPSNGYVGEFYFSMWEQPLGNWIYYSGKIETVLWDIMSIPFIDVSGQDSVYIKLNNKGPNSNFDLDIFLVL